MELKQRIEQLEKTTPGEIVLTLADDTRLHFDGTPLEFLAQAEQEFRSGGGVLSDAVLKCVHASPNFGKLHELVRAVWTPITEAQDEKRSRDN